MPGDIFEPSMKVTSSLRIGFARLKKEEISKGLKIIGEEISKNIIPWYRKLWYNLKVKYKTKEIDLLLRSKKKD